MQLKTCLIIALAACVSTGAMAQKKKAAKAAKTTPAMKVQPVAVNVKPVPADSFSYAIGVAQSESLREYIVSQGVDTAYMAEFLRGLNEPYNEVNIKRQKAYAMGLEIAEQNRTRVVPALNKQASGKEDSGYLDEKTYVQALTAAMQRQATMSADKARELTDRQMKYRQEVMRSENMLWLSRNKAENPDVKVMPSGLQYRIIRQGAGRVAADSNKVEVNYEGRLIDGTVFDSSYKRGKPASFSPKQVIKGWTEALTMMPEGSEWELYIPYNLAYGERGNQNIPPFATLIFKVEVLKVQD